MADQAPSVSIALTTDQALVLYEFLHRVVDERDGVELLPLADHDAELWALERLLGLLERQLVEPFHADYVTLVGDARERLSETCGGRWPWRVA